MGGAEERAERAGLGLGVVVVVVAAAVVGCGPVGARGAGFGGGSERRGTGPAAGVVTGSEWDSGPVEGFGFETAPVDELVSGLAWSAGAAASAETGRGLAGGFVLVFGSGGAEFAEPVQSSAPGSERGSEPGQQGEPGLGREFGPRLS